MMGWGGLIFSEGKQRGEVYVGETLRSGGKGNFDSDVLYENSFKKGKKRKPTELAGGGSGGEPSGKHYCLCFCLQFPALLECLP